MPLVVRCSAVGRVMAAIWSTRMIGNGIESVHCIAASWPCRKNPKESREEDEEVKEEVDGDKLQLGARSSLVIFFFIAEDKRRREELVFITPTGTIVHIHGTLCRRVARSMAQGTASIRLWFSNP